MTRNRPHEIVVAAGTLLAAALSPAAAQATWRELAPTNAPCPRRDCAVTYDTLRKQLVLFGGWPTGCTAPQNETWVWDGTDWIPRWPNTVPPARNESSLAYDVHRDRAVLFGGRHEQTLRGDTWEWDGTDWLERKPARRPTARTGQAMAFDVVRGKVVLFGGRNALGTILGDTWEWNGNSWIGRASANLPAPRSHAAMCYDHARNVVLMFGGMYPFFGPIGDTWEWDGANWTQRFPTRSPSPRWSARMAYDPVRRRVVLSGGIGDIAFGDTWEWDGTDWILQAWANTPGMQVGQALEFDQISNRIVMFGLRGRTWEYGVEAVFPYGSSSPGCTGPLAIGASSSPTVGNATFSLSCTDTPPNSAPGALLMGATVPSAAFATLGIEVWIDPGGTFFVARNVQSSNTGVTAVGLPIPADPGLRGARLTAQFVWLGPTTPWPCPPLGLSTSNALHIIVQ